MYLYNELKKIADQYGVKYFGVADLSPVSDEILKQGGSEVAEYPLAITMGIVLPDSIVNRLPDRKNKAVVIDYKHHAYDIINDRLDFTASLISTYLQDKEYNVMPVPAGRKTSQEKLCGSFSHKLAAHLAGLGWIGKSCLLITPEHGPRVRWITVLTDAPLEVTGEPMAERCGDCNLCVEACPVGAFTGRNFKEDEPREERYQAEKCDKFLQMKEKPYRICGMCIYICPYGLKEDK